MKLNQTYKNNISFNRKLSNYSWFNLGGPAEIFFKADSVEQLALFLKDNNKKTYILGAGSNTLIRDGGIDGVAIKLGSSFSYLNLIQKNVIKVGAATLDKKLSDFATSNSLSGFEFLSCIPGTVGGGIRMNSGCYGEEFSKILVSIETIDLKGNIKETPANEINFFYSGCNLPDSANILSANFKGNFLNKENIEKKQAELIERKKNNQPSKIKTCGSTFKNPSNKKAWQLIKDSQCSNFSVGGAKISEKHCNFFVNEGHSTASEIEELINKVKNRVFEKTGVNLELEIKIIGNS